MSVDAWVAVVLMVLLGLVLAPLAVAAASVWWNAIKESWE